MLGLSIRLRPADLDLLDTVAKKEGIARAQLARQMVEDSLHMMRLAKPIADVLYKDMERQNMTPPYCHDYLVYLCTKRYGEIVAEQARGDVRQADPPKSP
jgi:hypothetical protein